MGEPWLDVVVLLDCLLLAAAVAEPPASAPRLRRLRSGTWAFVRLRRPR